MKNFRIMAMDHIVLNVADIDRSLAFYMEVLGLQGERVVEFKQGKVGFPSVRISGDTLIDLMETKETAADGARRNLNHFCLVSDETDLPALVEELRGKGVPIVREPVSRWGARGQATSIYVLDPDGNEVEIRCY